MFTLLAVNTPIIQPKVPLIIQIPKLKPGFLLCLDGSVPSNGALRFEINLASGPKVTSPDSSDIAFHFNPRFKHGYVARNTLKSGSWGDEESKNPSENPFKIGKDFEIMILVESHQYKVAVNGKHFLEYNHRMPLETVNTLHILGDILLKKVEITHASCNPEICHQTLTGPEHLEFLKPTIPFNFFLPCGFRVGDTVCMSAKPTMFAEKFHINLETIDKSVVIFHFNPRLSGPDAGIVVRNSFFLDWQEEERDVIPHFPFAPGETFDLQLKCEVNEFLVAINGKHFLCFRYRHPLDRATVFAVYGDVMVDYIKLN